MLWVMGRCALQCGLQACRPMRGRGDHGSVWVWRTAVLFDSSAEPFHICMPVSGGVASSADAAVGRGGGGGMRAPGGA